MDQTERWLILSCAALTLKADIIYSEVDASFALKKWLNEQGTMLRIDAIELRRSLIDTALWMRSPNGREYRLAILSENHEAYPQWMTLQSCDYAELINYWVAENLAQRQARLEKFTQRV